MNPREPKFWSDSRVLLLDAVLLVAFLILMRL